MSPQEKGVLLRAIRMMVDRPTEITEETLGEALRGFKALIENSTGGMVEVLYAVRGLDCEDEGSES